MGPLQQLVFGKRNQIGRRLIVYIIAFSSLITLCISVVQLSLEYRELRSEVDGVLDSVGIHVPSLSNSVWDFDEKQIKLILGALAQLPHIERIDVTPSNADKTRWTAGKTTSARTVVRSYTLRHLDRSRDTEIGRNHPERGMIPPGRFIPVAEESGLIVPISEWVLREACRQAALWNSGGGAPLPVAVNLSAVQFKRSDIEQSVIAALEESGIDPGLLELELTESILISDTESVLHAVQRLKQLGITLSIDDFGTGYSSLSYLKRFEVDKLKIDQSFVRDLATNPEDSAIVRAIIQMAHSLNLTTIAEGVETAETLALLESYGCDEAQGYFFARPMPAQDILAFRKRLEEGIQ